MQRWLKVWFASKMKFKHHVKTKTASALRAFTEIVTLASTQKGLSYEAIRQLFQTCVDTISDFGAKCGATDKRDGATSCNKSKTKQCAKYQ